ncbi:MAG: ABC transporter ATP-binding protein [Hydrotalea sp.]|nr:ABC transporter ATP-binding protein [Hydrotalea sp.]
MKSPLKKDIILLKKLWRGYLFHYRWHYPLIILLMVITALSTAAIAKLVEPAIDKGLTMAEQHDLTYLFWLGGGFFLTSTLRGFALLGQTVLLQRISTNVIESLRREIFSALQTRPLELLTSEGTSKEISRFTNDVNIVIGNLGNLLVNVGKDFPTFVFLIGLLFTYNWLMTLAIVILFPLFALPVRILGRRIRELSHRQQLQSGEMVAVLDDSLKGAKHVRAYGLEEWQRARVNQSFADNSRTAKKSNLMKAWSNPSMNIILGIIYFMTLAMAGYSISRGLMTQGQFTGYLFTLMLAFAPIRALAGVTANINDAAPALERIFELVQEEAKRPKVTAGKELVINNGTIVFDKISFAYPDGREIFKNFSLTVPGGKTVALVGASGAGKSTLMNLIPRLYQLSGGRILIDGQDIKNCSLESLRKKIALVSQEQGLFDVSIHDNIWVGDLSADEAAIKKAATRAEAVNFINHLPHGFRTRAGELGNALSGGQKQRVSLARAFLRDAPIILLDEVTSALDAKTEKSLQKTWEELLRNRTALIIAHRLATVKKADIILVLDKGQIHEQGTHDELMKRNGLYAELAREQLVGE